MEKLRDAAIPVKKRSVNTDDAVELFGKHGMHDEGAAVPISSGVTGEYLQHWGV
ncbi:MAG: hypothetical protein ACLUAR_18955 [Pilosibacter sp.]